MNSAQENAEFRLLLSKIDDFIRKYYLNKIIKGGLIFFCCLLSSYLLVVACEYFGYFGSGVRALLFYSFILINIAVLGIFLLPYLLAYYKLGKALSHQKAAEIIGKEISDVNDKLINTLQLQQMLQNSNASSELIESAIAQRVKAFQPIKFSNIINLGANRKYVKYTLPPLLITITIAFASPYILQDGTMRLVHYSKIFPKKAPFSFNLENKDLIVVQGEDLDLELTLKGNEIPQDVYIYFEDNQFKLDKVDLITFKHSFKNLQHNTKFSFRAGEFYSKEYVAKVIPKPSLINMDIRLNYPQYLKKQNQTLSNIGDLNIPEGTLVTWQLDANNTKHIALTLGDKHVDIKLREKIFSFTTKASKSILYKITPIGNSGISKEEYEYEMKVIADERPNIQCVEKIDSLNSLIRFFAGEVTDDYGFSKLLFNYRIKTNKQTKAGAFISSNIPINNNLQQTSFFHVLNIEELKLKPEDELVYEFVIYDNDGVNGAKATHSGLKSFRAPSINETEQKIDKNAKTLKQQTEAAIKLASKISQESKKLSQELMGKNKLSYQEQKQVEKLLEKQKDLHKMVEELKNTSKKNSRDNEKLSKEDAELLEKQKLIDDLYQNVLDDKTKELLKNIEDALNQQKEDLTQEELSKMQMDNNSLSKELDRILELYKDLAYEQKLERSLDKLEKLAQQQEQKATENKDKKLSESEAAEQKKEEEAIKKEFEEIKKELEELKSEKSEQDALKMPEKEQKEAEKNIEKAIEKLEKKENAQKEKEESAKNMREMKQKIEEQKKKEEQEENKVNQKELKTLLKNLLTISFDQEDILVNIKRTHPSDPYVTKLAQRQKEIKDNMKMVQDSLYALSKKVPQLESSINKETENINFNINKALSFVNDRSLGQMANFQQHALTGINNLALMLNEVLEQMQKQQQEQQGGGGKKGSGGGGSGSSGGKSQKEKQSLSQLRKMQQELNKNMQKAREEMQKGGSGSAKGQGQGMSKQMAQMARQQQMIKNALKELSKNKSGGKSAMGGGQQDGENSEGENGKSGKNEKGRGQGKKGQQAGEEQGQEKGEQQGGKGQKPSGGKSGSNGTNMNDLIEQMEQTETELVNKKLTQEAIMRQQEILNKLLEAEESQREQDEDENRESKRGEDKAYDYSAVFKEYQKKKQREIELLKTVPFSLNSYYKNKVSDYFKRLNDKVK